MLRYRDDLQSSLDRSLVPFDHDRYRYSSTELSALGTERHDTLPRPLRSSHRSNRCTTMNKSSASGRLDGQPRQHQHRHQQHRHHRHHELARRTTCSPCSRIHQASCIWAMYACTQSPIPLLECNECVRLSERSTMVPQPRPRAPRCFIQWAGMHSVFLPRTLPWRTRSIQPHGHATTLRP